MYDRIKLEHDGAVSTLTLNRPPLNLVTLDMLSQSRRMPLRDPRERATASPSGMSVTNITRQFAAVRARDPIITARAPRMCI
jgi:hypothetical protein